MGGLLILGSAIAGMLLFADLHNSFVWISILVLLVYGLTGFADDYVKVTKQTANAMTAKMKLFLQFTTALAAVWVITQSAPETGRFELTFPWFLRSGTESRLVLRSFCHGRHCRRLQCPLT